MKKNILIAGITVLSCLVLASCSDKKSDSKSSTVTTVATSKTLSSAHSIGFVDAKSLFAGANAGKAQFTKDKNEFMPQITKIKTKVESLNKELKATKITKAKEASIKKEIKDQMAAYKEIAAKAQLKVRNDYINFQSVSEKASKEVAENLGLEAILKNSSKVYGSLDVTKNVIKEMNK